MKNIYLIRHGETKWNLKGLIQGSKNSQLTDLGKQQAILASNFFKDIKLDKIYTSDLDRALDTALILKGNKDISFEKTSLLREMNFGIWEGLTSQEVKKFNALEYETWLRSPENLKIKNAETLEDLKIRSKKFIDSIDKNDETIAIVGHAAMLKILILTFLDIDIRNFKNLSISNTGIIKLEVKDYNTVLKYFNSTSHLKELCHE